MKHNPFFRLLGRLRVGRKLLLIYLLDLSAVVYISSILIHEKYMSIDFSQKEIVGNAYLASVRDAIIDVAQRGAGGTLDASRVARTTAALANAEQQYGANMQSGELNARVRAALDALTQVPDTSIAAETANSRAVHDALSACRDLITRVGNQSNLILDPDLDSYYSMSLSILRYPALLDAVDGIGHRLHEGANDAQRRRELSTRYLVLEGQLDAVAQGLRSDFAEAGAANEHVQRALNPPITRLLAALETYRDAARVAVAHDGADDASRDAADAAQRALVASVGDAWRATGAELDTLLHARVSGLFSRMWLHLGTALFLLCGILSMVYLVAQQISRPLRQLARVMDTVRRTGDHRLRASWHSQDEIGQLVSGFNDMLAQLDHERDVQKELAATARASEAQHALVEATPVPMMVTAVPGHEVLHANHPALYWLNGRTSDPWAYGLDSAVRARFFQQLSDRDAIDEFEVRWMASEEPTWAMLSARRLKFQGRDAVLTAFTPINQIKLMEQRLELWAKVFEASSEAILILDSERRLLTANASFYRATGYRAANISGMLPRFIVASGSDAPLMEQLAALVDISSVWNGEAVVRRRAGGDYPAWLMISAVRDKHGGVSHYICTLIDITDRKKSDARIQFLAEHDVLTELPNRALFTRRLGAAIETARQSGEQLAVLFIDLDRFKDINDTLGHHAGDGLLRSVSRRLLQSVRAGDTVSRLGGDEFIVLLGGVTSAADVGHLIDERLLPLMREPHTLGGMSLQVACSIGIALYPGDGEDIETLMQNADAAMYRAKAGGRNLVKFFSQEMAESTRHRLELDAHLRTAVERGELWLAYQPCVHAETGELMSVEALLRWQHPHLGLVPPAQFIPIAEETRLIVPIGAWVIDEACRQIARCRAAGLPPMRVSINLSVVQLRDDAQLVERLRASLAAHDVNAGSLELEITETVLMESVDRYLGVVNEIRALGVKLSLDDFGTGYSSLSYLPRFPLDRLKIDRAFVNGRLDAPADLAVIRAIVGLGHELGLRVVAEGVEQEHEAQALRRIGCDELQGFLYAKPLPHDALLQWIQARAETCMGEAV
ncbi:EAL domain-containing protein [Paraburkholderia tropica]|uniref:EAL domain-containing protein n=1 Tax=Paraburkholderia tropica TaxID=92647 RepID=UPI0007ECE478|nr:EAL domain-containing protein [Paraburkholderia tropica]MBB2980038.1 diguanylate cyclase (GGDEF)-like protein/PAS domain S-box-containing protein [Paraburkholderia tropica]OBR54238.1 diguanylate phosphodiesterase [Paraburkholderia tropica]